MKPHAQVGNTDTRSPPLCAVVLFSNGFHLVQASTAFCGEVGDRIVYSQSSLNSPGELWTCDLDGTNPQQLTYFNHARLSQIEMGVVTDMTFLGSNDEEVNKNDNSDSDI